MKTIDFQNYDEISEIIPEILEYLPEKFRKIYENDEISWKAMLVTFILKTIQEKTKERYPKLTIEEIKNFFKEI